METNDDSKLIDPNIQKQIDTLVEDLDSNFVSQYEIAAQNVVEYLIQDRKTDFKRKLWDLIKDLLVTGYTFYRVVPSPDKSNV
jgi:hypothetical protein